MGSSVSVMMDSVTHGMCSHSVSLHWPILVQSQTEDISTSLLHVVSVHILHNMLSWVHLHMDEST